MNFYVAFCEGNQGFEPRDPVTVNSFQDCRNRPLCSSLSATQKYKTKLKYIKIQLLFFKPANSKPSGNKNPGLQRVNRDGDMMKMTDLSDLRFLVMIQKALLMVFHFDPSFAVAIFQPPPKEPPPVQ